jgi:cobalt-precorrin 5A hydrolase
MDTGMDTGPDKTAIWVVTPNGLAMAEKIMDAWPNTTLFYTRRLEGRVSRGICVDRLAQAVACEFSRFSGHLFIMSTGIVVRVIAPLIKNKTVDPAVVVMDDTGRFVISLVSGHIGGANALAQKVASVSGATPVITTATDVNDKPAIDVIATEKRLKIENPEAIKRVNMALLLDDPVRIHDPLGWLKSGGWPGGGLSGAASVETATIDELFALSPDQAAVFVDDVIADLPPHVLVLRPPSLVAGIGCNRHTPKGEIRDLLFGTLDRFGLAPDSLYAIATIDLKSDEVGLVALADDLNLSLTLFSRDQLNQVTDVPNPSAMVVKHLGVQSVCEASAILASRNGRLIVPKQNTRNVTVAIARMASTSSGLDPAP